MPLRTHYSNEVTQKLSGSSIVVAGWARVIREHGNIKFLVVADRAGTVQITAKKGDVSEQIMKEISSLAKEDVVSVEGDVRKSEQAPNGVEIVPRRITVLNKSEPQLPLDFKTKANLDTRLDARFLDVRKPEISAIFQIRDRVLATGRDYLRLKGCIEIQTPKIIASSSEGGTDLFPISYFEREAFLSQSPQLYKQMMMATGLDRVYEIATYFRAEQHDTVWHLNENTAFDLEMAFIQSEEDVMDMLEGLVMHIINDVAKSCKPQLATLKKEIDVPKNPPRLAYDECLKLLKDDVRIEWGEDLSTEAERKLGEIMKKQGHDLFFIKKYPLKIKPFYTMPDSNDPKLSNSFDLEYKGREISSGGQRVHLHDLLVKRIESKGLSPESFRGYLEAFRYGMPPHGGFGLGVERLLMQLLELPNIREAVLFPRDRKRLTP